MYQKNKYRHKRVKWAIGYKVINKTKQKGNLNRILWHAGRVMDTGHETNWLFQHRAIILPCSFFCWTLAFISFKYLVFFLCNLLVRRTAGYFSSRCWTFDCKFVFMDSRWNYTCADRCNVCCQHVRYFCMHVTWTLFILLVSAFVTVGVQKKMNAVGIPRRSMGIEETDFTNRFTTENIK